MKRLLILCLLLAALPLAAQTVSLAVTKSGSDVVLTWSGGTGPYAGTITNRVPCKAWAQGM